MPMPCHQARVSSPPQETSSSLPWTRATGSSPSTRPNHQEQLSPCCGAGKGPPSGLGVLQDPKAPGGRTTQAPTRRRETLYALFVSPADSKAQSGWFWHFPRQALRTWPIQRPPRPNNSRAV